MLFRFDDLDRTFDFMNDLHRRLDQALAQVGVVDVPRAEHFGWARLTQQDDALTLRADLPGVADRDLELSLQEDVLTVTASREVAVPEGYEKVHAQERRPFKFTRSYSLPCRVDPEKVAARLENGVLEVRLHKAEAVQPRQITVVRG
ncbi:MAG: Hsp20/alpha crystallin family protein [Myxococcales bacterium]|nr:Hsp20/alpha crystallin family protein [Myxococcales bacterium]